MGKLTEAQRTYLQVIPDWSARYEIMKRLGRTHTFQSDGVLAKALKKLEGLGLAEHGLANDTWRITDSGRAALEGEA